MANGSRLQHIKMKTKQDRDAIRNRPPYPKLKKINLFDLLRSRDLWMSLYFFIGFQLSIVLMVISATTDKFSAIILYMSYAMILGLTIHGYLEAQKRQRVKFKTQKTRPLRVIAFLIMMYIIIYALGIIFYQFGISVPIQENQLALEKVLEMYYYPMAFVTVILAPIVEELVFREYLPYAFGPSIASFVIFSIVFTILHSPTGIVGISIYGIMSAIFLYVRLKDNNVMTVIYLHMAYNLISLLMSQIGQ